MSSEVITSDEVAAALREVIDRRVVGMTALVEIRGQWYEVGDVLDLAARMLTTPLTLEVST